MKLVALTVILTICVLASPTSAETLHGQITAVIDGDSMLLNAERGNVWIRLQDVDCPEFEQPYGLDARYTTQELVLNKSITANLSHRDRYSRNLAVIVLPDGRILNEELIKIGSCWVSSKADNPELRELEAKARRSSIGLWAKPSPQPPWEFRADKRLPDISIPVTLAVWKKLSRREQVLYLSGIIDASEYKVTDMGEHRQMLRVFLATLDGHAKNDTIQEELVQPSVKVMLDGWRNGTRSFQ